MNPRAFDDPAAAREWCASARARGRSIGFVPTMGALHAGHLGLVRRAAQENDLAVVSVFVNPLQFDDPQDLERYPRDLEGDRRAVAEAGAALVVTGTLAGFFPEVARAGDSPADLRARIPLRDPGPAARGLEGAFRTGHFEGVATIVARLFETTHPSRAYFGAKDFQQTLVVQHLVEPGAEPRIVVCPTAREDSGLARSSRNLRLSDPERERAAALSHGLLAARAAWRDGERAPEALVAALRAPIEAAGLAPEYAAVRDPDHWTAGRPDALPGRARALVAAPVGPVRLIDNLALDEATVRAEEEDPDWERRALAHAAARGAG